MPFLVGLVADPATPARADLVLFLGALAVGYDETYLPSGVDVEAWRSRVAAMAAYEAVLADAPVFVELLSDPSPEVRVAALYVLAWLSTYDSLLGVSPAVVRPCLTHPSAAVRRAAAVALTRLGEVSGELTSAQQRVVLALIEVLRAWRLPGSIEELRTYAGL
ncbi:MAG: HEAT repeat domain-containing protein [Actinomycetota bacterium]|nr:HEAT repeat domain-containing protein [Actinomycetota bacterium]